MSLADREIEAVWDNEHAVQKLIKDGGKGLHPLQLPYLSLCYAAEPPVRPSPSLLMTLGQGALVWEFHANSLKSAENHLVAAFLRGKEAAEHLESVVLKSTCAARSRPASGAAFRGPKHKSAARQVARMAGLPKGAALKKDKDGPALILCALMSALGRLKRLVNLEIDMPELLKQRRRPAPDRESQASPERLARGLRANTTLKSLQLRNVDLSDAAAAAPLAHAIAQHASVVCLGLISCGLRDGPGADLLCAVVAAHGSRRDSKTWAVGLRKRFSYETNAAAAPRGVAVMGCLIIDASENRLGDAGACAIARALETDSWLVGLSLAKNSIGRRGVGCLEAALVQNASLCALVLDGNPGVAAAEERRFLVALERRTLPAVVSHEPLVGLRLCGWGFVAEDSFEATGDDGAAAGDGAVAADAAAAAPAAAVAATAMVEPLNGAASPSHLAAAPPAVAAAGGTPAAEAAAAVAAKRQRTAAASAGADDKTPRKRGVKGRAGKRQTDGDGTAAAAAAAPMNHVADGAGRSASAKPKAGGGSRRGPGAGSAARSPAAAGSTTKAARRSAAAPHNEGEDAALQQLEEMMVVLSEKVASLEVLISSKIGHYEATAPVANVGLAAAAAVAAAAGGNDGSGGNSAGMLAEADEMTDAVATEMAARLRQLLK